MNKKFVIGILIFLVFAAVVAGIIIMTRTPMSIPSSSSSSQQENSTPPPARPTQLEIKDEVVGTGAEAQKGDIVVVHYTGTLANGTIFDSSRTRNQPFVFQLGIGMVIEGWDKGIEGMKVGGKRTLAIPSAMAYGMVSQGSIPADSDLYFDVELLGIQGK